MGDLGSGGEECFSSEETFQLGLEDEQEFPRDKGQGHSGRVNRAYSQKSYGAFGKLEVV